MVLEKLGGSLREALRKIAGASYVDESLIKEIVRDIQRALIQADVNVQLALTITKQLQRPAAYDQLKQLAEQINAPFYGDPGAKDAVKIAKAGVKALEGTDVIIVDSSGRHALEPDLIAEIEGVAKAVQADERLLVLDATVGQQAGPQAKAFHDAVAITGVIVTK